MPDNILKFETAKSIAESQEDETDYVIDKVFIKGAITSLSAKIKVGKTTLLGSFLRAIVTGENVIGLATKPTKILYCTEEGRKSFKVFLKRVGLDDTEDIEVVFLGSVNPDIPWATVVKDVLAHALEINAGVVIFDTLTRWARIPPDKENDPGTAAQAMIPLEVLRGVNIAVVAVFHDRKSGGEVGDSQRGSSAYGGAADIIVQLGNPFTNGHANRRQIKMVGRFDDPFDWLIDWDGEQYVFSGDGETLEAERSTAKAQIALVLQDSGNRFTQTQLGEMVGIDSANGTLKRALDELVKAGQVRKSGDGKKGSPYLYQDSLSFLPN